MPPDLSVRLGPLELKNPVVCASGEWVMRERDLRAAVESGAAAVVAKSANESEAAKRQLRGAEYAFLDERWRPADAQLAVSVFNRSGLVDEPWDSWVETLARADAYARSRDAYVVASLVPADLDESVALARDVEEAGIRWLELNVGAAHGEEAAPGAIELADEPDRVEEVVRRVRDAVSIPLTVKLPGHGPVLELARAAHEAGTDAVCLVGRPLAFLPDLETRGPLLGTFAAFGGPWALPLTLRWVAKARQRFGAEVPLVATNGVRDGLDVARALLAGASAAELGTVVWTHGFEALTRTLADLAAYLEGKGASAEELVGQAADAVMTYEEAGRQT
jgi:dihydroorotate dehydrogenase (NAD+) catalytic subunit